MKISTMVLLAAITLNSAACYTVVEPGHAGIKINMSGGDRGVDNLPISTGRVFYNPVTTRVFEYPTFVQTAMWTAESKGGNEEISFNSKEGIRFTGDISLSYQLTTTEVPAFYVKFRTDNLETFTHGFLRNIARDGFTEIAPEYTAEEIYSSKMGELVQRVRDRINQHVNPYGVHVEQFGFIGAPRPPESITNAITAKTAAIQNAAAATNRLEQTKAEAQQTIAKAEGEAGANRALTASLSPSLLEWRSLGIQEQLAQKWNGQLPQYTGGGMPMLQLPTTR
jgi:regulator of protease activity HflC (stomatin/prohibitin superfamily)